MSWVSLYKKFWNLSHNPKHKQHFRHPAQFRSSSCSKKSRLIHVGTYVVAPSYTYGDHARDINLARPFPDLILATWLAVDDVIGLRMLLEKI